MKNIIQKAILTTAALATVASSANNLATIKARCELDSLNTANATGRVNWAIKCAKSNGGTFHKMSTNRLYGLLFEFDFDTGKKTKKARPEYPIFTTPNLAKVWKAPTSTSAACTVPGGYVATGYCTSSCYTPDQSLLFADGEAIIKDAYKALKQDVMVLDQNATLSNPTLRVEKVGSYIRSHIDTQHDIIVFKTEHGKELKVTENHPLVNQNGKMRRADSFKAGDSLVGRNGQLEKIVSITMKKFFGKVYNIEPKVKGDVEFGGFDTNGQIVIAQGYLSGSNWYQNSGEKYLERSMLRNQIPDSLL